MEWFKNFTNFPRTSEYMGCEPVQRATWFNLINYCVDLENKGVILNCKSWTDRRWQQTLGVTEEEAKMECELYWFDGEDLHVFAYPDEEVENQKVLREKRSKAGQASSEARKKGNTSPKKGNTCSTHVEHMLNTCSTPVQQKEKSVQQREREREREKEQPPNPPVGVDGDDVRWKVLLQIWESGVISQARWPWESWHESLRSNPEFDCEKHGGLLLAEVRAFDDKKISAPTSWFASRMRTVCAPPPPRGQAHRSKAHPDWDGPPISDEAIQKLKDAGMVH